MKQKFPKVSVVTVTYNCVDLVEGTMRNVLKQTYPNIEYIVIDGNSSDGTRQVIERYADRLAYWVSEPDSGIYDAMNKGICAATGEWIIFMNAGDYFFQPTTVEDVFDWYDDRGETFIAGGIRLFVKEGYFDRMSETLGKEIWDWRMFPHQATFTRLSVQKENLFSMNLKIVADYHFIMKMMLANAPFAIYNGIVALFRNEDGASTRYENFTKIKNERLKVMQMLGASEQEIQRKKQQWHITKVHRWLLAIIKAFPFIYAPYHLRMYTRQPLEETLRDV